ncbi:MAG: DUF1926 domain-containing protein [Candidatus Melainabacteria bacterium]|nr:DUF1926 domain-containing protein [Candidatus Melainabacteria bacterium]MBI3308220.1 DUF1926 domain-containing protein [Candidatus Melainabacteria bacterium]
MTNNTKKKLLIGIQTFLPSISHPNGNKIIETHVESLAKLIELLNKTESIKTTLHLGSSLLETLDKKYPSFSSAISNMVGSNRLELLSGGMYEPLFPFIPKEDRQIHFMLMNRFLNHTYGYNPTGTWITECVWEPGLASDISKSRLQYTCLSKDYFTQAGLEEKNIQGYYVTEEEGRKIALFPITYELNSLISQFNPIQAIDFLQNEEKSILSLFFRGIISSEKELSWLTEFYSELNKRQEVFETELLHDFYVQNKPSGRIYLTTLLSANINNEKKPWKYFLIKYPEVNLLHKKMLRVSKKINSAKEGKSRFKVIKEMINKAQDLLLQGQHNSTYWDNPLSGFYIPEERFLTYEKLIKAENLIEAASRKTARWAQTSEIDYDCDGNDEIIIETDTQNIYISPALGGTILEHDFKPSNINIANSVSRKKEYYHTEPRGLTFDLSQKLNLTDHIIKDYPSLENCKGNKLNHLTDKTFNQYAVEKIKAKEESCKTAMTLRTILTKHDKTPEIELQKTISTRAADSSVHISYTITNKSSESIAFFLGTEFNLSIAKIHDDKIITFLNNDPTQQTPSPGINTAEEIKEINQITISNKKNNLDISLSWNKKANVFKYPIETLSFKLNELVKFQQGFTIFPIWEVTLEPNSIWEVSIIQNILNKTYEG